MLSHHTIEEKVDAINGHMMCKLLNNSINDTILAVFGNAFEKPFESAFGQKKYQIDGFFSAFG